MQGNIHSMNLVSKSTREKKNKASKTHAGANTLRDDLFLLPLSTIGMDGYHPSSSLPISATLVQDLANFTPGEEYPSPVPVSLVALKCLHAPIMAVFEQVQRHSCFSRTCFLPLCSATWCFRSEVFVGLLPGAAVAQRNVPCSSAPHQQMPFLF